MLLLTMPILSCSQQRAAARQSTTQPKQLSSYTQKIDSIEPVIEMIAVPGGGFVMGSPDSEPGRKKDEGPLHTVKLAPFYISKYEITWDLYELFVYKDYDQTKATGPNAPQEGDVDAVTRPTKPYLDMTFGMGKEGYPAVGMTQYNAIQFCKWLYSRTGIFYRLPTEAEWEYACRAGSTQPYPSGNDTTKLADYAWYKTNSNGKTQLVGQKKPNAWGLYDMNGNAAEWTADQYIPDYYERFSKKEAIDPVAEPVKLYPHVIRGGSFDDLAAGLRSASRTPSDPRWKRMDPQIPKSNWWFPEAPFVGIRIVRPAIAPPKEKIDAYYNRGPIPEY